MTSPCRYLALALAVAPLLMPAIAWAAEQPDLQPDGKAGAPETDNEHIFGFADGADIGAQGEREIESVTVGSFGALGSYKSVGNETSFRYGVTDRLRLSIGTLSDFIAISNVPGLANRAQADLGGLIGEVRVLLVDRATSSFGMSVSINPQWRQFDALSGEKTVSYAIPVTLLVDKALIPDRVYAVGNFIYTPTFERVGASRGNEDAFTVIAGLSYAFSPRVFAGGEIRHDNLAENGAFIAHALFIGPNLFYRVTDTFTAKVAFAAQIPDAGSSRLDLAAYQRYQVELHLAYNF